MTHRDLIDILVSLSDEHDKDSFIRGAKAALQLVAEQPVDRMTMMMASIQLSNVLSTHKPSNCKPHPDYDGDCTDRHYVGN